MDSIFSSDALVEANIAQQIAIARTHNLMAIANDLLYMQNYDRNAGIYKALGMNVPPRPAPPMVSVVDPDMVRTIFLKYNADIQSNSGEGLPTPELDYTAAITESVYVRPVPPVPVGLKQPDNPLGASMGKGKRGQAPGDVRPIGDPYTDANGDTWIKMSDDAPFGPEIYWQRQ